MSEEGYQNPKRFPTTVVTRPAMNKMTPIARKTAKDFPQELLELYDFYAHGRITKREFLDRAGKDGLLAEIDRVVDSTGRH